MQKMKVTKRIYETGAMAIVRADAKRAHEIAKACMEGGIDVLEVSFSNNDAGDVIKYLSEKEGDKLLVGAGTVLDPETCRIAILSGAKFVIAPNFNKEVALMCNRYQIAYCPGCTTVNEMIEALEYGAAFIKAFPISNFYGPDLVKVLKTPIPELPLLASGGITMDNLDSWMKNGIECCGFGGLLTKGSPGEISENARKIREVIKKYK